MSLASSTARSIAKPLVRSLVGPEIDEGTGGGPSYDVDALDYFTRAEGLGGSFDLTGINVTYTEAYVKTAISNFVAGCKTDSIWTKLTEIYLLGGVTFGGLMAKLKHAGTATLTNVGPFVTGDYVGAGSGAGLVGDNLAKYLDTSFDVSEMTTNSTSWSLYNRSLSTECGNGAIGASNGVRLGGHCPYLDRVIYSDQYDAFNGRLPSAALPSDEKVGFIISSRVSSSSHDIYRNGSSIASNSTSGGALPFKYFRLFNGYTAGYASYRATFSHIGAGLDGTEAVNLSTRVNTLMTAIGANV